LATFLVESYEPRGGALEFAELEARALAAAESVGVTYLRSIFVPEDETCFHFFEAASIDAVREASERAQLGGHRIVHAVRTGVEKEER
jgi:hypothetical protein